MRVLVTGGAGYIGRHVVLELHQAGHTPEILDHLGQSRAEDVAELEELLQAPVRFHHIDIVNDKSSLLRLFRHTAFDAVVHLAALKSVPESFERPLDYYQANVAGTLNVAEAMAQSACRRIIFSSSACVYGAQAGAAPLAETLWPGKCAPSSPYSLSKDLAERVLLGLPADFSACSLRYFNPLGAHPSGRLGDTGGGNVIAFLLQALRERQPFTIHGTDYSTRDGTCIRDYIHVHDVARAHVCVMEQMEPGRKQSLNVGLGKGTSVLELLDTMREVAGIPIHAKKGARRKGDAASSVAHADAIRHKYGWSARYTVRDMCRHAWAAARARDGNG